ncbi:MAG: hypothetical protein FWC71_04435 [Defluviitaleaceae bacterium]|nr:hypothetical protein [Defluviitaleaceae bacterium]
MMFPYITLAEETEVTHSQLLSRNNQQEIEVHFERPTDDGFNEARCILPSYKWISQIGYTNDEVASFTQFLHNNAHLLFKYAETGGLKIA